MDGCDGYVQFPFKAFSALDASVLASFANTMTLGLDTTATELSVVESVFRLGEGMGPSHINTTNKDTMVESFY